MAEMVKRKKFLDGEVLDLSEQIALTSPTDTPLSTLILGRGAVVPAKDITVTWRERKLNEDKGTLKLEGAEAGEVITSTRGSLSNVCQIIEKVTQVSGTAQALHPLGIGNSFTAEVNDRLVETKRDMANIYHSEVIPHVPVDTSRLVDNITIFGEGIPHDFVEVGTNVEYALYVNDGHVQHKRFLPADKLSVGGKAKYLKNRNQKGIMLKESYVNGSFFMEKGMQDAKPRLNRLVESFLQQIGREIEGGSL